MISITKKELRKYINITFLAIVIFSVSVLYTNQNQEYISTNANISDTKKIEWGIKRNTNHEQPDVGRENKRILDENKGICLGNKDKKYIYLTFDEGYEAGYTTKILEILKQNNVKGAFFITAHYVNSEPDLVKQMINEGHVVGNHIPLTLMTLI